MLTFILTDEYTDGQIRCILKMKGRIVMRSIANDWEQAIAWVRAMTADPPAPPDPPRTKYQAEKSP